MRYPFFFVKMSENVIAPYGKLSDLKKIEIKSMTLNLKWDNFPHLASTFSLIFTKGDISLR